MLTYPNAKELIKKYNEPTTQMHVHEVEVVMRGVAKELKQDEEQWEIAGLLHDIDFDLVKKDDVNQHGTKILELIGENDLPADSWHAIRSHCEDLNGVKRENNFDYALAACDNISGMVYATTLIYPDKKIVNVKPKSVIKRLKTPAFARNVNRQAIYDIEKTGITLERFVEIAITEMTKIADEIGL